MIHIISQIERLSIILNSLFDSHRISDYKAILDSTNRISVYLKGCSIPELDVRNTLSKYDVSSIYIIESDDDSYDFLFLNGEKIDTSSTRLHLGNMLSSEASANTTGIPTITFYSYKGGVGRSTTLATFASHLAITKGLKVAILDCDFEAPGFNNFFLENPSDLYYKNGLIEYFIDSTSNSQVSIMNYCWETSKKFSGKGSIYVFPSGNLSIGAIDDGSHFSHLDHYIQGLSRLDIFSTESIVSQFSSLFQEIKKDLNPDVILLDSRTGFNDVYGITAFRLSNLIVGFFGDDAQTIPGLNFILNRYEKGNTPQLILANAIIPNFAKNKLFKHFVEKVHDCLSELQSEEDEFANGQVTIDIFPIGYNEVLKNIGLSTSSYEDYISIIENCEFPDYNNLFMKLASIIDDFSAQHRETNDSIDIIKNELECECSNSNCKTTRQVILQNINTYMPSMYGEGIPDFDKEYTQKRYYFRKCMEDLFNPEKLLVLGNKGTGKTYIYRSLSHSNIVTELRNRASKGDYDYEFIQIINDDHRFDTHHLDNQIGGFSTELFFERFWKVYIWTVLVQRGLINTDVALSIKNDTETALALTKFIKDDLSIVRIEQDIQRLDEELFLNHQGKRRIVIIFDELDSVVKPILWSDRVSPLINYCRKMSYSCISPKLFLRSDLYKKITNITNKNELINRSISIEWTQDEMFDYFFKFMLSHSKNEIDTLIRKTEFYSSKYINKTFRRIENNSSGSPIDEYMIKHLCIVMFGKYADDKNSARYGESYDWFYNNLKNADGTISLRPFIDLLSYAVKDALDDINPESPDYPILPARYYTNSKVRVLAVQRHFNDLANEEGNTDLKSIFEFIHDKASGQYKRDRLWVEEFEDLADQIISTGKLKDVCDSDGMLNLLLVNGIVSEQYIRIYHGDVPRKAIRFALLYKYYLGLGSGKTKRRFKYYD